MTKNILIATADSDGADRIHRVATGEGYVVHRAYDSKEALGAVRKHLPNVVFLDFELRPATGAKTARGIVDVFNIDTTIVILHDDSERRALKQSGGLQFADFALSTPTSAADIEQVLNAATDDPGFDGDCRVTFIDANRGLEEQTDPGSASVVETGIASCVVLPHRHEPDWAGEGTEIVAGDDGQLLVAFTTDSVKRKRGYATGIDSQCWYASGNPF